MQNSSRRSFLKSVAAVSTAAFAGSFSCAPATRKRSAKNVIMMIGDDHSSRALGCYGNQIIRTPNLDRLASQGVKFTSAFANAPMCSASRQSLLTGKYPHADGVTLLRTSFPKDQLTVAEHLASFGFQTGYVGKMHFNNNLPHGFHYRVDRRDFFEHLKEFPPKQPPAGLKYRPPWKPFRDPARIWLNADMLPSEFYDADDIGTWYAHKAMDFIEHKQKDRFCLWLGFHEPHSPFNFPIEFAGRYKPEDMPLPQGSPEDDQWIPAVFKDLSEKDRRGIIASYYTSVEYLDKNIGLVVDKVAQLGLADETLIIYIGDHGYLLNDHKRFEKHMMWEPAVGAPLIIRDGRPEMPRSCDALCEFVDLAPTIFDALDVPPMPGLQGKSLAPLLEGKANEHKDWVFSEFLADNKAMLRTREWKYIFTSGEHDLAQGYATGRKPWGVTHRLYNEISDPNETTDVSKKPENQQRLHDMQQLMIGHFLKTDPRAPQLPRGLSTDETLAFFCTPPDVGADIEAK